jgi:hypothetical protein
MHDDDEEAMVTTKSTKVLRDLRGIVGFASARGVVICVTRVTSTYSHTTTRCCSARDVLRIFAQSAQTTVPRARLGLLLASQVRATM